MRIGIVAPPWVAVPPPAYGGTEAVIETLGTGLVRAGHDVVLFATGDSTSSMPTEHIVQIAPGIDVGGSALEFHHVVAAYEAFADFDIVHDHTILGPLLYHRLARGPVVTTNHNPFSVPFKTVYEAIGNDVPIIAISHDHARRAGQIPIAAVIHHGLDLRSFPVGSGAGGYVLFLGRMTADKGAHRAIQIARAAQVRIILAGKMQSDAERSYFDEEVAPLLGEQASYLGEVDYTTKIELLGGALCLLNPISWPEPFGMVMIEALACATPVLAFARGAAPEIVEDGINGYLGQNESDLVAALRKVDSLTRRACRESVERRFSAEEMVANHLALYERVIAQHAWSTRRHQPGSL